MQERHGAVDRFDPRLATALVVVEARVLIEELELLNRRREEAIGLGEGRTHLVGDGPLLALLGVLGAVQDVGLRRLELARGLQGQLDGVLDDLDRGLRRPRRHDVDDPHRQLRNRRVRRPPERGKAAADGALDAHRVESHDPSIAFDDGLRQRDFLDAFQDASASLSETQVELRGGRNAVGGMDGPCIRMHHVTFHGLNRFARLGTVVATCNSTRNHHMLCLGAGASLYVVGIGLDAARPSREAPVSQTRLSARRRRG